MVYSHRFKCLLSWFPPVLVSLFLTLSSLLLLGCSDESEQIDVLPQFSKEMDGGVVVYRFGIHPLHNPSRLHEIFDPLMAHLSQHVEGVEFKVEASRNYAAYDEKLFAGEFHFSLPNPYQTVKSLEHGYRVFGKMGDDYNFRGIILVRKDGGVNSIADLKGKPVSYPAPTALAATMLPLSSLCRYFLVALVCRVRSAHLPGLRRGERRRSH